MLSSLRFLSLCILVVAPLAHSQSISPVSPAYIPLVLRSPYLNAWTQGGELTRSWPTFWNQRNLGWAGYIRVDGVTYQWLGNHNPPFNATTVLNTQITPTQTIYTLQAGSMSLNLTFLSPITLSDPVKQSFPFAYVSLDAVALDGQSHNVQVYSDIDAEWTSGQRNATAIWSTNQTSSSVFHQAQLQSPAAFQEITDQAQDATTYFASPSSANLSSTIGAYLDVRQQFGDTGSLPNPTSNTSGIIDSPFVVYAFASDLGNITQTAQSVIWAVGNVRNPAIAYTTGSGTVQNRAPYFVSEYSDIPSAIDAFLSDFNNAKQHSDALDAQILNDTTAISSDYSNLVSLAMRQAIGSTELTIGNGTDGKWNTSDVMLFMKDVGTSGRVNPVETLYASLPLWLYLNATYAGALLSPLLQYQDSPAYTQPFAAQDLGTSYPLAPGNNQAHTQGIEQSGNMLIMSLAHARISGDGSLVARYYPLLKRWADYLVQTIPDPSQQSNADMETQVNMTNLIVKGLVGIQAMSEISKALGNSVDALTYSTNTTVLSVALNMSGISTEGGHMLATYGNQESWTLPYNLFADRLLQTGIMSDAFYASQTQFLGDLLAASSKVSPFGLPVDTTAVSQANAAWTALTAAIVTNSSVRDGLFAPIWTHATANGSAFPLSDIYKLDSSGALVSGRSSPAMGALFAPLILRLLSEPQPPPPTATKKKASIVGPVVGAVLGGKALIAGLVFLVVYLRRRRRLRVAGKTIIVEPESLPSTRSQSPDPNHSTATTAVNPSDSSFGLVVPSMKARIAMQEGLYIKHNATPLASGPSSNASTSNPAGSVDPPSVAESSQVDLHGLRTELQNQTAMIEHLRNAVREMEAEMNEAPPSYSHLGAQ
ncbi:hypothetical protein EIP91_002558 [Steccherinum ochraceum]|uniref:DUF1793-domain-containing protein n=1 Tax=Steccherinum ochraceum TaxID=92696 RepID=A0A4R0RBV5_9APHY|nr:hypothetical protein EIP91_002558 [Steccherinum ochraceum]